MDLLESTQSYIVSKVADGLCIDKQHVVVVRRTQDLKSGELSIPLAPLAKALTGRSLTGAEASATPATTQTTAAASANHVAQIAANLANLDWTNCPLPISHVTPQKNDFRLHIQHGRTFSCLCLDLAKPEVLQPPSQPNGDLVLHVVSKATTSNLDLVSLRTAILAQHIERLAQANGYRASYVRCPVTDSCREVLQRFGLAEDTPSSHETNDSTTTSESPLADDKILGDTLWQRLSECPYRQSENDTPKQCNDAKLEGNQTISIDLRRFLEDQDLPRGHDGYSPNIKGIVLYRAGDETLSSVHRLSSHNWDKPNKTKRVNADKTSLAVSSSSQSLCNTSPPVCFHVVPHTQQFHAQQVDLTWRLAQENPYIRQCHVVHGSVKAVGSGGEVTTESYLEQRKSEMRESFVMKYGPKVKDAGWDDVIEALTVAVIRFEMLTTSCRNELKICLRGEAGGVESNRGVFVMYNGARLATLERHFQEAVQQGVYPALPPVTDVDFSLLGEGEWLLAWKHLVPYLTMVRSTTAVLGGDKVTPTILTHKVCSYLHDLCRDLSSYYSHTHVLQEPQPHLLPLMFARLHLLKALHTVFTHALSLLNITPITQI